MVKNPQENGDGTPGNATTAATGPIGNGMSVAEPTIVSGPGFGLTGLV